MKNKMFVILVAVVIVLLSVIFALTKHLGTVKDERDRYESNTNTLLTEVNAYKTKDSLNVTRIDELRLREDEFKRYRSETDALVKTLNMRNRELIKTVSATTVSDSKIVTVVRDSIINDTLIARCIDYDDNYLSIHGCADGDTFIGDACVRDSLVLVESVQYKRFLGFLWKTKKIKNRKFDIVSKNKNTHIDSFEVITVE